MNLKNIALNTAELGPVKWEDVEKLQPGTNGYILFVSSEESTRTNENGEEQKILVGTYLNTEFKNRPTYKEIINFLIKKEFPNGKEEQLLRLGIKDPNNSDYLDYYDRAESIRSSVKLLLDINN